MNRIGPLLVLAAFTSTALAQPGGSSQIYIKVRPYGSQKWEWYDHLSAVNPDFSPIEVEVGVFYRYGQGYSVSTAVHNIIGAPFDASLGDAVEILDNPASSLHPDGRVGNFNFGAQRQQVYHTGTGGIDANRFRIAAFGNSGDVAAGGISARQNSPSSPPKWLPPDSVLMGYHFRLSVACAPTGAPRTVTIDAPHDRINTYSVFSDQAGTSAASVLNWVLDTDIATVTVSAPSPGASITFLVGMLALAHRRRDSNVESRSRRNRKHEP